MSLEQADTRRCNELADLVLQDPNIPEHVQQTAEWYKQGFVDCDTFWNGAVFYANAGVIGSTTENQSTQEVIQLTELGRNTIARSEEIQEQALIRESNDEQLRREIEANSAWIYEVNARLSDNVVNLGEAVTDASKVNSDAQGKDLLASLGIGLGVGSIGVLAIVVALFIARK